jgi:flagellar basal-body rod protein FlgF
MSDGIWSAVSGATAQLAILDAAANNVANASTPGYRAERALFRAALGRAQAQGVPARSMRYAALDSGGCDVSAGSLQQTGRPLDVALRDDGFFRVRTVNGERYTRAGSVQLAKDGTLVTKQGDAYLDENGRPIKLSSGADAQIAADGTVREGETSVARLGVVRFADPAKLAREGSLLLVANAASGAPTAAAANLETGHLEMANVTAVAGMIEIVSAQRAFEACESAIQAFKDADSRAAMSVLGSK